MRGSSRFPSTVCVALAMAPIFAGAVFAQGPLAPPGAPAPTMKTLEQVEPRIPIDSLPITITNPGSYYVTADLTGVVGQDGITVAADNVTLDLNGFVLSGLPGQTTGHGIREGGVGNRQNITVKNGAIRDWSSHGIDLLQSTACHFSHLTVTSNGNYAIAAGSASLVADCSVVGHPGFGVVVASDSVVKNCIVQDCLIGVGGGVAVTVDGCHVRDNASSGVDVGAGSVVSKTTSIVNGSNGFRLGEGSTIRDCAARLNNQAGIRAENGSTVIGCSLSRNAQWGIVASPGCTIRDCTVVISGWDGINASNGSTIRDCTVRGSGQDGIEVASDCRVEGNLVEDSGAAAGDAVVEVTGQNNEIRGNSILNGDLRGLYVTGTGNVIADNVVRGSADNYDFAPGNQLNLLLCEIPESIDWPASVKLAGTLTGIAGTNGITVNASEVTIDLSGHALVGVPGSLDGIGFIQRQHNIHVQNGTIRAWGQNGVAGHQHAFNSSLENVHAISNGWEAATFSFGLAVNVNSHIAACTAADNKHVGMLVGNGTVHDCTGSDNGGTGIEAGGAATITACVARNNGGNGIGAGGGGWLGSLISDCVANRNNGSGIDVENRAKVVDCTANGNGQDGINTLQYCAVQRCATSGNGRHGILAMNYARVSESLANENDEDGIVVGSLSSVSACTTTSNGEDGISIGTNCHAGDNTCTFNGFSGGDGAGIHATGDKNRIDGNTVTDNDRGIDVDAADNIIVRNTASNNSTNYAVATGNTVGEIVDTTAAGGTLDETHSPWANFSF